MPLAFIHACRQIYVKALAPYKCKELAMPAGGMCAGEQAQQAQQAQQAPQGRRLPLQIASMQLLCD